MTTDSPVRPPRRETITFPTFEEYLVWALKQEERTEWVEGEVIFVDRDTRGNYVPTSILHQILVAFLYSVLRLWLMRSHAGGTLLFAPVAMQLPGRQQGREPDLLYVAPENAARIQATYIEGPADLCVEIVSPESIDRDRDDKFFEYENAGVREYWLIDPQTQGAQFFRRGENGRYFRVPLGHDGAFVSEVIAGLSLLPAWLWQEAKPEDSEIVAFWESR